MTAFRMDYDIIKGFLYFKFIYYLKGKENWYAWLELRHYNFVVNYIYFVFLLKSTLKFGEKKLTKRCDVVHPFVDFQ